MSGYSQGTDAVFRDQTQDTQKISSLSFGATVQIPGTQTLTL